MNNKSRKHVSQLLSNVKSLKDRYEQQYKEIGYLIPQEEYEQSIKNYDRIISRLNEELQALPVVYRYKGIFYIKNSYTIPATFEKHEGVLFMREDLVSWQIEEQKGSDRPNYGYYRSIYKDSEGAVELKRNDAEPVYKYT